MKNNIMILGFIFVIISLLCTAGCIDSININSSGSDDWSYGEGYGDWDIPVNRPDTSNIYHPKYEFRASAENGKSIVVVGNYIFRSSGGDRWNDVTPDSTLDLRDIVWNGNQFLAVGGDGRIAISSNGAEWSINNGLSDHIFHSVIWDGTQYLATSYWRQHSGKAILTSSDGLNWTVQFYVVGPNKIGKIVWTGEKYVSNGNGPGCNLPGGNLKGSVTQISTNGIDWESHLQYECMFYFDNLIYADNRLVAVNREGLYQSTNGVTWEELHSISSYFPRSSFLLAWSGERFVGFHDHIYMTTSTDGINWTRNEDYYYSYLNDLRWTGKRFIAVGGDRILLSNDGLEWTESNFKDTTL